MSTEDIRLTGEDDGKRCRNHHLIVIGNGFDLSCGLASSFKDFFEPRMRVIDSLVSEKGSCDYEAIKARGLTAWDLILRSRKDMEARAFNVNWCDVETAIANVFGINLPEDGIDDEGVMISDYAVSFGSLQDYFYLVNEANTLNASDYIENRVDEIERLRDSIYAGDQGVLSELGIEDSESSDDSEADFELFREGSRLLGHKPNPWTERVGHYLASGFPRVLEDPEGRLSSILMSELERMEHYFNCYLKDEVARKDGYLDCSDNLMRKLIEHTVVADGMPDDAVTVLNFNYTSPYRWLKQRFGDAHLVNIHGTLDGECIFGIDGSGNLDNRDILPFTKTYRVLKSARGVPSGSIAYPSQKAGDGLKTSSIVFFGHSLSRADYSYFESIFSTVDLYNGHTSLVFLYSNYAKGVRESEVAKVLALLDYYGASFGIAGRSNNLAHKLMLEGRLVVREI
ncbi:MAG TPA: bacteriophage abortive infection AbiH family protein [Coriobacteriaceae bacterium]|nr:bacteriophage abortive infection AbiH family protein [Coriobacteriaceae bacterium]